MCVLVQEWSTVVDAANGEWKDSVQLVFEYFCERTPRSFVEQRGTSLVWNYKYADVEFGRIQARDLLQHLLTGPISNAPVDIVRGSRSIEVRPVGVSKGSSMDRVLNFMAGQVDLSSTDFVMVAGHFLARDENVFTFFEGQRTQAAPQEPSTASPSILDQLSSTDSGILDQLLPSLNLGSGVKGSNKGPAGVPIDGRMRPDSNTSTSTRKGAVELPFSLPPKYLFTCTVGRSMASKAQYCLNGSVEVAELLHKCAQAGQERTR